MHIFYLVGTGSLGRGLLEVPGKLWSAEDGFYSLRTIFVIPEHTPILFFYLRSFFPKNPVFVTQIAKICNKVTIFSQLHR
jgi:hypothetical protein